MARSDGFDSTLATVILDEVSTDEAKLIIELAYGQDRCIDYLLVFGTESFKVGGSEGWCSSSCRYACCVAFLFSSMTVMAEKPQHSQS